jgi:hypothetical protein
MVFLASGIATLGLNSKLMCEQDALGLLNPLTPLHYF